MTVTFDDGRYDSIDKLVAEIHEQLVINGVFGTVQMIHD